MNDHTPTSRKASLWAVASLGLIWNLFGLFRFFTTEFASKAQHMAAGMTPEQAAMYIQQPIWMKLAFAIGVFGGAIGCALLLIRRRQAVPVFWASLVGYLVLYIGDIALGIFAAFGAPQITVLTLVLVIAAALLWYARRLAKQGTLA